MAETTRCFLCGSPDVASAEGFDSAQEPKVERYRVLLSALAISSDASAIQLPIDLPDAEKEAIGAWTRDERCTHGGLVQTTGIEPVRASPRDFKGSVAALNLARPELRQKRAERGWR